MLRSHLRLLPLVACGAVGLVSASPALAASSTSLKPAKGDQAALTLSAPTKRDFSKFHVALKTTRPATRKGNNAYLPEKSGKWNFANSTGSVTYKGVWRLTVGKKSAKLTNVTFQRSVKGKKSSASVTTKIGKKKVTLFTLTGKVKVKVKGTHTTISGLTATVPANAAKLLNADLKKKAFKAKQKIGSFSITLTGISLKAASGTGTTAPGAPGAAAAATPAVGVNFSSAFTQALGSSGLSATPIAPAAQGVLGTLSGTTIPDADGTSISLPAVGGTSAGSAGFDNGTLTGTIPLSGGLQIGNGLTSVNLTSPVLSLGTGTEGSSLSFSLNGGPEIKLLDIDTDKLLAAATPNGELDLSGLTAELSTEGADSLNQVLGTNAFQPQQLVGGLTIIAPSGSTVPSS
jgi:hypothetical protein